MSIKNNAMIVSLSVGKPQMTKTDNKATLAAEKSVNAKNAGRYRKDLYPNHLIQPIRAVEAAAREYLNRMCYCWGRGEYLLPAVRFMPFAEHMAKLELQFDQCVTAFLQNWVNVMDLAKDTQGDMFNSADYPDLSDLKRRFRFSIGYSPVTDTDDFRMNMQEEEAEALRKQVEAKTKQQMEDLMREPLERLRSVVQRLNEVTQKDERVVRNSRNGKTEIKAPIFRDTVCDNIIAEINLLYDFEDILPESIVKLANNVVMVTPTAETLRSSQNARDKIKIDTDALLGAIDDLLRD
jgi:hypothetical protein